MVILFNFVDKSVETRLLPKIFDDARPVVYEFMTDIQQSAICILYSTLVNDENGG